MPFRSSPRASTSPALWSEISPTQHHSCHRGPHFIVFFKTIDTGLGAEKTGLVLPLVLRSCANHITIPGLTVFSCKIGYQSWKCLPCLLPCA